MAKGEKEEAEKVKAQIGADAERVETLSAREKEVEERIKVIMMTIPNIIDPTVPIGKDDSENVEVEDSANPLFPILRFLITQILWKPSTVSIWIAQERLQAMASIT